MTGALLVGVWLARYLGPEQYGTLSYALSFVALFSGFASLGLEGIVIRDILAKPSARDEILGSAFVLRLAAGSLCVLLTIAAVFYVRPQDTLTIWLVGVIAIGSIFQSFDVIDSRFQAEVNARYSIVARNIAFLGASIAKIVLIVSGAQLIAFAVVGVVESFVAAVGLVLIYRYRGGFVEHWRICFATMKSLLRDGAPVLVSSAVIMMYMRVDQVMLGELANFKEVGDYSVAVRITEVWYIIPTALTASLLPAILKSKELSTEIYLGRIQSMYDLLFWLAVCGATILTLASRPLVVTLFGAEYEGAADVLMLQAWMAVWVFFGVARQKWLFAENALKAAMYVDLTAAVLNVVANYFLIPPFGAIGAASASLITAVGANLIVAIYSRPIRDSVKMYARCLMAPIRVYTNWRCQPS